MKRCRWCLSLLTSVLLLLASSFLACAEPSPAEFEVVSLEITPPEVTAGEAVSVTAEITNIGGSEGIYTAVLAVNGVEVETKDVTVPAGATETVTFSLVKDKAGAYQVAVGELSSSLSVKPKLTASEHLEWGDAYCGRGQWDDAIAEYSKAIELAPNNVMAYIRRALAYGGKEQWDMVIADSNKAIALDPDYAEAYKYRGWGYNRKGERDLALADLTKAIELDPNDARTYGERAIAYMHKKGQSHMALADLTKAIELDPNYANGYRLRGKIYGNQGKWQMALADFNKAIELNPDYALGYRYRGFAYQMMGEDELAIADFTKSIELNPYDSYTYFLRAFRYEMKKQYDLAIADYNKVIELSDDPKEIEHATKKIEQLTGK